MWTSNSGCLLFSVQHVWTSPSWQVYKGFRPTSLEMGRLRQTRGLERARNAQGRGSVDFNKIHTGIEETFEVICQNFVASQLDHKQVPIAHVCLHSFPSMIRPGGEEVWKGMENIPRLYLSEGATLNCCNVNDFARLIPGLLDWIELILLETGMTSLVIGGASFCDFMYKLVVSLNHIYGNPNPKKRPKSRLTRKVYQRLEIVIEDSLCCDYTTMTAPMCKDCFTNWSTAGYKSTETPSCAHEFDEDENYAPKAVYLKRLEEIGVVVHSDEIIYKFDQGLLWQSLRNREEYDTLPCRAERNNECNEPINKILESIEIRHMRQVEKSLQVDKAAREAVLKAKEDRRKYFLYSGMRNEDQLGLSLRAFEDREHDFALLEDQLGKNADDIVRQKFTQDVIDDFIEKLIEEESGILPTRMLPHEVYDMVRRDEVIAGMKRDVEELGNSDEQQPVGENPNQVDDPDLGEETDAENTVHVGEAGNPEAEGAISYSEHASHEYEHAEPATDYAEDYEEGDHGQYEENSYHAYDGGTPKEVDEYVYDIDGSPEGEPIVEYPWEAFEDDAGFTYYYNHETCESTWEHPY